MGPVSLEASEYGRQVSLAGAQHAFEEFGRLPRV